MSKANRKIKKVKNPKIKSVYDFAKTEDEKYRLRRFFEILLQIDRIRMKALEEKEKSAHTNG